ncbi:MULTISPECIES: hypothetical protein [unclassified Neisseria]|uniref:hypothetical protein n=1 Tax=unclassified Neisseria TaxID=2623750 RepID=UPI0010728577|nr:MULTISPECIES: hypothetical protein [unclassified Neisseria]MBF0804106.1 hypothetical protein [Neisseria sp. 19428wB4_WF04]TFU43185.1 hypothetical protein E4T99_07010 [Neisseria sp. WF04]
MGKGQPLFSDGPAPHPAAYLSNQHRRAENKGRLKTLQNGFKIIVRRPGRSACSEISTAFENQTSGRLKIGGTAS